MRKIRIRKRRVLLGIIALLFVVSVGASFYFFHVAQIREEKSFINNNGRSKDNPLYAYEQSFDQLTKETLWMTNKGLKQDAWYVPAETATNKTVIVVHGFTNDKEDMKPYAWMFHELGYNVLMPDNMSHGDSEGQIIGYGWNDRLNVIKWAELLVEQNSDSEITLFGVSMGAATVMMASGEESLPDQVVNIIEDCGYSSVWDELKYQAKEMYNLPAFPILYEVSAISKIRAGFSYGQASSVNQLKNNTRPVLFIHGSDDTFVPTSMVYKNYQATQGEKELYIVKGVGHAKSFETDPQAYIEKISTFLKKYEK
ncbi:alpha/beta hydrolase [Streptococcus gallolyticus]|uniref:alpha/beta hydrolase n=1 Tax=Streptococcus gallolyticus TaxID=315405 RepID=UPI0022B6DE2F|nr:alpha/beta hydrolase [Streptococcus gallolyticus]WAW99315.1 alpha/beta hydrolase [Streptococcus gallolyticus]